MAVKKFILIVFSTVFLTLIKKGHNYPCPFSLKGSENSAGSGYRSVKTDVFFSRLSKKIDNVIPVQNLIFMITTKRNKIVGLMPKAQLKNPRRIFFYVDDIITELASIRKILNSFGTDKLNIPKKYTIFQKQRMDCLSQVRDEVDLEHQEAGTIDAGLLDQISDDEVEEQQMEVVDRAPKRVQLSGDGDVQSLNDGIAKVKVSDGAVPGQGISYNIDRNPENDPSSESFLMALMGVNTIVREAPVADSCRASPKTSIEGLDPYCEFDPRFFKKSEPAENPLNSNARQDAKFLGLVGNKGENGKDWIDDKVDRRRLTAEFFRGHVNAFNKGKFPDTKVEFESTFDGDVCVACGPNLNGEYHGVAEDNRVVVLGDAHVPPLIGSNQGCLSVIRIIGGSPKQLADSLLTVLGRQTTKRGKKRFSDGSGVKPKMHILWSVNSHIHRVGINCALMDIGNATSAVQSGLHKDFTSSIVVTPWGMMANAEIGTGHEIPLNSGKNAKQNHALQLLGRAAAADGVSSAEHVTIMTKGFTAATVLCPAGEERDHDGIELHVQEAHPVLLNRRALYLPDTLSMKALVPGILRIPGMHLAMQPAAEFSFLSALVDELKSTKKFRMNFLLPDDNQILYGVSQGIPLGKSSNKDDEMMASLIDHAKAHHAKKADAGHAIISFKAPGSGSTRFKATGEIQVVGNSQAKRFAENFEKEKRKFLAENNFSMEKNFVGGQKGDQLTCSAHIDHIFQSSALKKESGSCVFWVLSNMMLADRFRSGNYQILAKPHSIMVTEGIQHPRKKKGDKWTNKNVGYVSGDRRVPNKGFLLSGPIHTLNSRARSLNELGELLADLLSKVRKLLSKGKFMLIVGPMPRHPERCCLDNSHMDSDFSPDEFTRMCYLVSTFMAGVLKQKNVSVLHPGEIFGWGEKPDIMRFVSHDGVHLNDAGERAVRSIIQGRLHAFKLEREKAKEKVKSMDCGAGPDRPVERSEGVLEASQFVGFAGMMVANGLSYSKPKSSLAGDL